MKIALCASIALALISLVSCNSAPVTDTQAARIAATCIDWPEQILDEVALLRPAGPIGGDGLVLAFRHAHTVIVRPSGSCQPEATSVMSGNLIRHLPPTSFTELNEGGPDDGIYILMLLRTDSDGDRVFVAMKGGAATFQIPPGRDA